jgi:putative transposase
LIQFSDGNKHLADNLFNPVLYQTSAGNFYAAIKSAQERKKSGDSEAKYPKRRKWFYKITWKSSAIRVKNGKLILSNGKGNQSLEIEWQWDKPKQVEIGWKSQVVINLELPILSSQVLRS